MALKLGCCEHIFPLADQQPDDLLGMLEDAMQRRITVAVTLADGSRLILNGSLLQYAIVFDAGAPPATKAPPIAGPSRNAYDSIVDPSMFT